MKHVEVKRTTEVHLARYGAQMVSLPKTVRVDGLVFIHNDFAEVLSGCDELISNGIGIFDPLVLARQYNRKMSTRIVCKYGSVYGDEHVMTRSGLSRLLKSITFCKWFKVFAPVEIIEDWLKREYDVLFPQIPGEHRIMLTRKGDDDVKKELAREWR